MGKRLSRLPDLVSSRAFRVNIHKAVHRVPNPSQQLAHHETARRDLALMLRLALRCRRATANITLRGKIRIDGLCLLPAATTVFPGFCWNVTRGCI